MWGFVCLKCVCFVKVGKPRHKYEAHGPSGILRKYIFYFWGLDVNPEPGVEVRLVAQDYAWCHWEAHGSWRPATQNSVEFMLGLEVLSVLTQSLWFSVAQHKQGLLLLLPLSWCLGMGQTGCGVLCMCSAATGAHKSPQMWGAQRRRSESLPNSVKGQRVQQMGQAGSWAEPGPQCCCPHVSQRKKKKNNQCVPFPSRQWAFWLWTLANGRNDGC